MAGLISSLLDPSRINLDVQSEKRTHALSEVARPLANHPEVLNFDGFYQELLARERLDTTCLGNGIALPHARTEHVKTIVMSVGRSRKGILFEATGETVRLLFMVGTPKTRPGDYLAVVSALCKLFKDAANREAFLNAGTEADFIAAVVAAEDKLAGSGRK
jgi:mannitol/fructose-specific phosphotransferase system IIA component (Ntr-type)